MWHYAVANSEPSLHVTVGVHLLTGIDLLNIIVAKAAKVPAFRRAVNVSYENDIGYDPEYILQLLGSLGRDYLTDKMTVELANELNSLIHTAATLQFTFPIL